MGKKLHIFKVLLALIAIATCSLASLASYAQDQSANKESPTSVYFNQFFSEKVLTVTREGDGILPGTLRNALIQASLIRSQNSFTMVKIVFDPMVKRIRITNGPLPEIDGSLTTLDCLNGVGRGLIEGADEDTEGQDPAEEIAGLKLTSNGNTIRNCHITGFAGPGILIRGNRNQIEYDTIGYHKDAPETAVPVSTVYDSPKTNKGAGILIGASSSENSVQNNEIIANTFNGVELAQGAGRGNKIAYNYFSKNSGKPIKVIQGTTPLRMPQITKITKEGEYYVITGTAEPRAGIQIYLLGKDEGEIGLNVIPESHTSSENFQISTKNKGFVPNQTKVIALTHSIDGNSSEFSNAVAIPGNVSSTPIIIGTPESAEPVSVPAPKSETPSTASKPATDNDVHEIDIPDGDNASVEEPAQPRATLPNLPTTPAAGKTEAPETSLNVKGVGDKGGTPDSGSDKSHEVSSLGI